MSAKLFPKFIDNAKNAIQVYVDATAGSDVAEPGRGSILQPYQTIHAALAAIALLPIGDYVLELAPGTYGGVPIAWPTGGYNVSMNGAGIGTNIGIDITFTSQALDNNQVVWQNIGMTTNPPVFDLALASIATIILANGGFGFSRIDTLAPGPQSVRVWNSLITSISTDSLVQAVNCHWIGGPANNVGATGAMLLTGCTFASMVAVVDGQMLIVSSLTSGTAITGAGTVGFDASSQGASIVGPTSSLLDNSEFTLYNPTTIANWTPIPANVKAALDILGSNIQGNAVVFKPGGVAGKNLYTTWADVMTAVALLKGPTTIYFDDTNVTPAVIPAGAYALENVTFANWKGGQVTNVQVAAGVTWTGLLAIRDINVEFLNTALVETIDGRAMFFDGASITANGTAPIWDTAAGAQFQMRNGSSLNGTGAVAAFDIQAGQVLQLVIVGFSSINASAISGGATATLAEIFGDSSNGTVPAQANFTGTVSTSLLTDAARLGYTAGQPVLWQTVPTDAKAALDSLVEQLTLARTTFIYQPGGVTNISQRVFATWADLYQYQGYSFGPKVIQIDDSLVSPAVVPAGAYDLSNIELVGAAFQTVLELADGVTFTGLPKAVRDGLRIDSVSTAPIFTALAGDNTILLDNKAVLSSSTAPFFNVDAGASFQLTMTNESVLINAGAVILDVDAGGTGTISEYSGSAVANTTTSGAGSITVFRVGAPDRMVGTISGPQAAAKQIDLGVLVEQTTVVFTIQGLTGLVYSFDYTLTDGATSTVIDWTALGLDGVIVGGENFSVQFWS
jgi:hypothetical protein